MGSKSSTTTTNQNQQATTVPQTPTYAADPVKNYFTGIENYQQTDPYSFVTPVNTLQTDAFQKASSGLFQTGGLYDKAADATKNVISSDPAPRTAGQTMGQIGQLGGAAQATAQGYQAPALGSAAQVTAPVLGNAAQSQWAGLGPAAQVNAPNLGDAAQASASLSGNAAQAQAANAGTAQGVNLQGYQAGTLGNAAQANAPSLGSAAQAQAASLLDNFQAYQNPATQNLVSTTLAGMDDNAARVRAAQQAQASRGGAFGGSRYAIQQAQTESDLARERGLAEANLRSQAWNAATQLSGLDAGLRQQAGLFNAGAQNQRDEYRAGLESQTGMFNAGQNNQFGLAQFDANNSAARYGADAANQGSMFNAAAANDFGLANAGFRQQAGLANAAAQNDVNALNAQLGTNTNLANMQARNQFGLAGADLTQQANLANMGAQNQFAVNGAQMGLQNNQFNAQQGNQFALAGADLAQQAGLANMGAQNQFSLANAGMQADAAQFGAGAQNTANLANMQAQNTYGLANFDAANQMNMFNAGQANNLGQFNAGQLNDLQMQQRQQQLQGAGLLGDIGTAYGNNYRADLGTQLDMGNSLYNLENIYNQAPLTQLQNVGNLLNPGLIDTVSSRTVTGQNSGVAKEQQSGGLFNTLLGIGSIAAPFIPSDRRLKRNIEKIGEFEDGLGQYEWQYVWGGQRQRGVMADEVAELRPWALGPVVGGYATVNMEAL
jgi:hypothetical protein